MTKAMPFLQKVILLSYDPRLFGGAVFLLFIYITRRQSVLLHRAEIFFLDSKDILAFFFTPRLFGGQKLIAFAAFPIDAKYTCVVCESYS